MQLRAAVRRASAMAPSAARRGFVLLCSKRRQRAMWRIEAQRSSRPHGLRHRESARLRSRLPRHSRGTYLRPDRGDCRSFWSPSRMGSKWNAARAICSGVAVNSQAARPRRRPLRCPRAQMAEPRAPDLAVATVFMVCRREKTLRRSAHRAKAPRVAVAERRVQLPRAQRSAPARPENCSSRSMRMKYRRPLGRGFGDSLRATSKRGEGQRFCADAFRGVTGFSTVSSIVPCSESAPDVVASDSSSP